MNKPVFYNLKANPYNVHPYTHYEGNVKRLIKVIFPPDMARFNACSEIGSVAADIDQLLLEDNVVGVKFGAGRFYLFWIKTQEYGRSIRKQLVFFYTNNRDRFYMYPLNAVHLDPETYFLKREIVYPIISSKPISLFSPLTNATSKALGKYAAIRTALKALIKPFVRASSRGEGLADSQMRSK